MCADSFINSRKSLYEPFLPCFFSIKETFHNKNPNLPLSYVVYIKLVPSLIARFQQRNTVGVEDASRFTLIKHIPGQFVCKTLQGSLTPDLLPT